MNKSIHNDKIIFEGKLGFANSSAIRGTSAKIGRLSYENGNFTVYFPDRDGNDVIARVSFMQLFYFQ